MRPSALFAIALVGAVGLACHRDETQPNAHTTSSPAVTRPLAVLIVPDTAETPMPLVLAFHGYGGDAEEFVASFGLDAMARKYGFVLAAPNGTMDSTGRRFFTANDGCCDFEHAGPNDVAYALTLVADLSGKYAIDKTRVYAIGFSNGGAMANRLACDASEKFAAVVDFAGPDDLASCHPTNAVSMLHIHGTADTLVPFEGGSIPTKIHPNAHGDVLPALRIATLWSHYDGCLETPTHAAIDLVPTRYAAAAKTTTPNAFAGAETAVTRWGGCRDGSEVQFWAIDGAGHIPPPLDDFAGKTWAFLSPHRQK